MNFTCNSPHSSSRQVLTSFYRWGKGGNAIFYQLPIVPGFVSGRAKIPNLCVSVTWGHCRSLYCQTRTEQEVSDWPVSSSTSDLAYSYTHAPAMSPGTHPQIVQYHCFHKTPHDMSNPQRLSSVNYRNSNSSSVLHYLLALFWKCWFMHVFDLPKEISIYLREEIFFCPLFCFISSTELRS